jgi:hypothetical protein
LPHGFGQWFDASIDCSLAEMQQHAETVDDACCTRDSCAAHAPATCSPTCGAQLIGLTSTCNRTANLVFDMLHSAADGVATDLIKVRDECLELPSGEILQAMQETQADGCAVEMDGVAAIAVPDGTGNSCVDAQPLRCSSIGKHIMDCNDDFCPGCTHAHECDLTCGFCQRRRTQITVQCPLADFQARQDAVEAACCSDATDQCDTGVPAVCDALCASEFLDFYTNCHRLFSAVIEPSQAVAWERLADTCGKWQPASLIPAHSEGTLRSSRLIVSAICHSRRLFAGGGPTTSACRSNVELR